MVLRMSDTYFKKSDAYKILDEFSDKPLIRIGISVSDLEDALRFYVEKLGCQIIKEGLDSVEIDFFGYSVVLNQNSFLKNSNDSLSVHEDSYFGLIVGWADWHRAVSHLTYVGTKFKVNPKLSNHEPGKKEAVFILEDPNGNLLRFVAYED